jgi:NADH:ubiquinone oxidoreductase subunit 6 (subunit J)
VSPEDIAFLALGAVAVGTALAALLVRELVHTIIWIATFFVALAGIYFLLEASFLGVLQLGVYAGAVTILLLFGIMVTRRRIFSREAAVGVSPLALGLALLLIVLLAAVAADLAGTSASSQTVHAYAVPDLSAALFGPYGGWLLVLGSIMLAALSGAIYLVREGRD